MFILKEPKSENETLIYFFHRNREGRVKVSTGKKVHPDFFVNERCTGKYKAINQLLDRISAYVSSNPEFTKTDIEAILKPPKSGLYDYINDFINAREAGRELAKSKIFSPMTIKHYRHTVNNLLKYEAATGTRLNFNIKPETVQDIISFFQSQNQSTNTIGKTIKNLKVFLKAAYKDGISKNKVFESISIPSEETPAIYLNENELELIANAEIPAFMEPARQWFLIEAYTGLRVSDVLRLKPENIKNDRITIANEKTDEKVVLPVHPSIRPYFLQFPGKISEQKINKYIKEIGRIAGLDSPFLFTITKGGRRQDQHFPKWKLLTNHTGRRSFITNLLRAGTPHQVVMKLSGIKKITTLERYNKLSHEETADWAASLPFFK